MCERCYDLEEQVQWYQRQLYGHEWTPPRELRLTRCETAIIQALMARDMTVTDDVLLYATRFALGKHATRDPEGTIVKVWICKIRSKLAAFGLRIETVWAEGYRMNAESRARLLNWNQQEAA